MKKLLFLQYSLRKTRQAKFWKPKHYEAIPYYYKPHFIDIHDTYIKRSIDDIKDQLGNKQFELIVQRDLYAPSDPQQSLKQRKAKIMFEIEQFNFSELQLQRFKILMGPRYNQQKKHAKITCEMYETWVQNHERACEMLHDVIMQSKRAP